jgi:fucose permease
MNLGAVYSHNTPGPLQKEIQTHMNISDSQFNNFYSAKAISSMILPFFIAILYEKLGLEYMLLTAGAINAAGTYLFLLGISFSHYSMSLLGRILMGLGDVTVFQSTLTCTWFPISDIAWAGSWRSGLAKGIRTFSSTIAPMVFNTTNNLTSVYWIDFSVALLTLGC